MRQKLFMLLMMVLAVNEVSAQNITFSFSDGIDNENLKTKVEKNISLFLTHINKASRQGTANVDLSGVMMTEDAKEAFDELWQFLPFKCTDDDNMLPCTQTVTGYCVRGIPVIVTDKETNEAPTMRELTIAFNANGQITGVFFALEQHLINHILPSGIQQMNDLRKRTELLNNIERYRDFYDRRDIKSIEDFFTADAIIITGTVGMEKTNDGKIQRRVDYTQQNKQEYIDKIRHIFQRKGSVKLKFKSIEVIQHPARDDIYMVRLHQNFQTQGYEDNGYVTFLWIFPKDGGAPKIMVSTWLDESTVKSKDDLFKITDFNIH